MQLDFSIRVPRVPWNADKRIFLCCLHKIFERDSTAFKEIFNAKYRRDLENSGFTDGRTSSSTLDSQWGDMRRLGDPIWGRVHKAPLNHGDLLPVKDMIIDVARSLGVSLVEKEIDDIDTSGYRARTAKSGRTTASDPAALTSSSENSTPHSATFVHHQNTSSGCHNPSVNVLQSSAQPLTTHGGKVCWWCLDQEDDAAEPNTSLTSPRSDYLPPLLYRWSNADSQGINTPKRYIAGLFADSEVSPFLPEHIAPEKFNGYVLNHVSIASHPSPFISTFQSILAPIHRAIWGKEGARVSIIDTRKLTGPVYFAKSLVQQNKIRIPGYSGVGEYLIWGEIQTPAIICSFKITTIIQIAQENEDIGRILQLDKIASYKRVRGKLRTVLSKETDSMNLDHASGVSLGKLLQLINVPQAYSQMVGEGILRSWQLRKQGDWQEFRQGLEVGFFTRLRQTSSISYLVNLDVTPAGRALARGIGTDYLVQHDTVVHEEEEERFEEIEEDDEDDDDDVRSIFDTPCPVRLAHSISSITPPETRPVTRIELYNPATGNWSLAQESQQSSPTEAESFSPQSSVIVLDDFEEEIEELGDMIMGEDISDLGTAEHPPTDQFASDRERIRRFLK
ncbi:hypothetical protein IFM61392_05546 [Aspergillus lentulus]|uniref:DUF7587 domain-containing protein n=1 Tax=Aspergillus lentulus TaxID=293939 RepID=A0ABQ1AF62_ASPLE|nr:hypothetical protein IFM60648_05794 [Aspergillus lentulus]GFF81771.1 hypothetical protein IFM47457_05576 [Aspergillus lentulus]GFG08786.1 hypothetical protein IFM61392_05546 [Aspergillus lentulus]